MRRCTELPDVLREISGPKSTEVRLHLRLATPMIGGGAVSGQPDLHWPIRASSIRGQLRFWWRATHGYKLSPAEMKKAEASLWGWANREENIESAVSLSVESAPAVDRFEMTPQGRRKIPGGVPQAQIRKLSDQPQIPDYVRNILTQGEKKHPDAPPVQTIDPGYEFILRIRLRDESRRGELEEALRAWLTFGGIGMRTRRGAGALEVMNASGIGELGQPSLGGCPTGSPGIPAIGGAKLVLGGWKRSTAFEALADAIRFMRCLRKGAPAYGTRTAPHSRARGVLQVESYLQLVFPPSGGSVELYMEGPESHSRWPERESFGAQQRNTGGRQAFPRARFGLPMQFRFVGGSPPLPNESEINHKSKGRFGSPIVVHPLKIGDRWQAGLLVLQNVDISGEDLIVGGRQGNYETSFSTLKPDLQPEDDTLAGLIIHYAESINKAAVSHCSDKLAALRIEKLWEVRP